MKQQGVRRRPAVCYELTVAATVAFLSTTIVEGVTVGSVLLTATVAAANFALAALARPGRSRVAEGSTERQATITIPVRTRFIGMGGMKTGMQRTDSLVSPAGDLWRVGVFDCGETQGVIQHFINNEPVELDANGWVQAPAKWQNLIRIIERKGTADQAAVMDFVNEFPDVLDSTYRLRGLSYVVIQQKPVALSAVNETYPRGATGEEWTAVRKGSNQIYDPRDGSTGYSDNAALCFLNFLTHPLGGNLGLEWFALESWKAAADACDVLVATPDNTVEPKYRFAGIFEAAPPGEQASRVIDLAEQMRANCNARLYHDQTDGGKIGIVIDAPPINDEAPLTAADVLSVVYSPPETLLRRRDVINSTFVNPDLGYSDDTTPFYPSSVSAPERIQTFERQFCPSRSQAGRLDKIAYQEATTDTAAKVQVSGIGYAMRPAQKLTFDMLEVPSLDYLIEQHEAGPTDSPSFTVDLVAIPADYAVFDASTEMEPQTLPVATTADGQPLDAPGAVRAAYFGTSNQLRVVWGPPPDACVTIEIEWSPANAGSFSERQQYFPSCDRVADFAFTDLPELVDLRVRYTKLTGGVTDWTVVDDVDTDTPLGAPTAPTLAGNSSVSLGGSGVLGPETITVTPVTGEGVYLVRLYAEAEVSPPTVLMSTVQVTDADFPVNVETDPITGVSPGETVYILVEIENISGVTASETFEIDLIA